MQSVESEGAQGFLNSLNQYHMKYIKYEYKYRSSESISMLLHYILDYNYSSGEGSSIYPITVLSFSVLIGILWVCEPTPRPNPSQHQQEQISPILLLYPPNHLIKILLLSTSHRIQGGKAI